MPLPILQEGISGVSKIFIKEPLKKWWDYHRIDREIFRRIKDTYKDEGYDFEDFFNDLCETCQ